MADFRDGWVILKYLCSPFIFAKWCSFPNWHMLRPLHNFHEQLIVKIDQKSHVFLSPHTQKLHFQYGVYSMCVDIRTNNNGYGFSFRGRFRIKIESSIIHSIASVNSVKYFILIEQWKTGGLFWCLYRRQNVWLNNRLAELIWFFAGKSCLYRHEWIAS